MPMEFPKAVPEIPVANLNAAITYYITNLGFQLDWGSEDGDGIAGISRGQCRLFLAGSSFRQRYKNPGPMVIWLNLESKAEVDALHNEWTTSHATIVSPPESKPWQLHEFTAGDPDGNILRVFYDFSKDSGLPA